MAKLREYIKDIAVGKINVFSMVFKSRRSLTFAFEMKSPNFVSLQGGEDWKGYWFKSIKVSFLSVYVYVFVYIYVYIVI